MKKLTLKFFDASAKKSYSVTVQEPKEALTKEQIEAAMTSMIGVFVPAGCAVDEGNYVDTQETQVFNNIGD
ncbi:MAG TPA: DUF2922 domain-containing protein [Petrotogaceae bacterium]|mgnify:FL=1|jgi:hypothetical protein|nr:DUF2922 domain-containing protein [Petrotogaceae bacterium]HNV06799.1 DUF2922 domain-containing protein [Petrotogaceae bacterium]HPG48277.1 DUF2922 domain-containing protein [Petrotogaceae bacterium]HPO28212.1 DUF2922 domain-containing protein [Petrotogaceae bacterium]HQO12854.1 DUF2922 domain-containing protein [Petrotogaceae bacterium]